MTTAKDKHGLGNNSITMETFLSANFADMSQEVFVQAIRHVDTFNRLIFAPSKCNNPEHYEQVISLANLCLRMKLFERRQADKRTKKAPSRGLTIDLDAEFPESPVAKLRVATLKPNS